MLSFRLSSRRAVGHGVHLSNLASGDTLFLGTLRAIVAKCDQTRPFGPPTYRAPSDAMCEYVDRKKKALHASYFRQRYGRDYWTGLRGAASPSRLRERLQRAEYEVTSSSRREFHLCD